MTAIPAVVDTLCRMQPRQDLATTGWGDWELAAISHTVLIPHFDCFSPPAGQPDSRSHGRPSPQPPPSPSTAQLTALAKMKTVDPAEVKMEATKAAGRGMSLCKILGIAFCVLFVVLNVAALYVLHFVNRPSPTTRFTFENFAATTGTTAHEGDAVSFNTSAVLRNGAGTTAYLDVGITLETGVTATYGYVNYLSLSPLGTTESFYTTNLMSYVRVNEARTKAESVVTTVTFNPETKAVTTADVVSTNVLSGYKIKDVVTLSDTLAVAAALTEAKYSTDGYAIPITIDSTGVPTVLSAKKSRFSSTSGTIMVGAFSSTAFVVAYYDAWSSSYSQYAKVGVVASDGTITYTSTPVSFGPDNADDLYTTFGAASRVPYSTKDFLIPYFQTTSNSTQLASRSGLCVTKSSFTLSSMTVAAFTDDVCQTNFMPSYYVESLMISDTVLALAFYDGNNNDALTVATVAYSTVDGSLSFRSSYVFPEVAGSFEWGDDPYGFYPQPTMRLLSGNRLAVTFLNPSQSGKMSTKVLRFSLSTLSLRDATPVLPVSALDFTLAVSAAANNFAIVTDMVPVSADGFLAGYLGNRDLKQHNFFSVVEAFGAPVGILRDYNGKSKATVAVSGKAKVSGLTEGVRYYATTSGSIVAAGTSTDTASNSTEFMYASGDSLLVTADSVVGISVDSSHLFVSQSIQ